MSTARLETARTDENEGRRSVPEGAEEGAALDLFTGCFNTLPHAAAVVDERGVIVAVNAAWRRFGDENGLVDPAHGVGRNYLEITEASGEAADAAACIRAALRGAAPAEQRVEYPCHGPGVERWFRMSARRLLSGGRVFALVLHELVTAEKRALAELMKSEERFRAAAESGSDLIWDWDIGSGAVAWFGEFAANFGMGAPVPATLEEWKRTVHPEDLTRLMASVERHIQTGAPYHEEFRMVRGDGAMRNWVTRGRAIRDSAGVPRQFVGMTTDVTERKVAAEALVAREEELRLIIDSVPALVGYVDRFERYRLHNDAHQEWLGLSPEEIAGQPLRAVLGEENYRMVQAGLELALTGSKGSVEGELRSASGATRWVRAEFVPRLDARGQVEGFYVFVNDLTDRREAETQRLRKMQMERELDTVRHTVEAMEQVLGVVSHELRSPLASLRALSEFVLTDGATDTAAWRPHVARMHGVTLGMAETIDSLLDAARANAGKVTWDWEMVDLETVCREAMDVVRPQYADRPVELSVTVDPECRRMRGDSGALRRLVVNLLSNACKGTTKGWVRVRVFRSVEPGGAWTVLEVADTGRGIPADVLARLGEPFALSEGISGACRRAGTGLGLSICRTIVSAHGGQMAVSTRLGAGTTFTIQLRTGLLGPALDGPVPIVLAQASHRRREDAA